ncbi:phenylalanine--tRNA ligase subunit beta [bacterium]|nr:phenylalanine--tRNA ligase subunit beta [bacterium]
MKASYKLLKELIDFPFSPEELAEKFTMTGTEVEDLENPSEWISNVVVAKILEVRKDFPRKGLSTCSVSTGDGKFTTITGAPDVEVGKKCAFALPGAKIFGERKIEVAEIEGEKSEGMLCSGVEVGLGFPKDRLLPIPDDVAVGKNLKKLLGWEDETIFEMEVTPNRPDCYGHWGLAREIAAVLGKVWEPEIPAPQSNVDGDGGIVVKIQTPKCPRYAGRLIEKVSIKPSPLWLAGRLAALGTRPINNIVDITNYVMLLTGQPIHAFDEAKLGREIVVRQANAGEKMFTLDDVERTFSTDVMLIATPEEPVAVAGIMGGRNSEVDENTKDIVVEVAHFDPATVRKGSKLLQLTTESSTRFEKGTDPEILDVVSEIVAEMTKKYADAQMIYEIVDQYPLRFEFSRVTLTDRKVKRLLGVEIPREKCREILVGLGFDIVSENAGGTTYGVPSFRPDVKREVDLVEEVGRIYGLWNIPSVLRAQGPLPPKIPEKLRVKMFLQDFLSGLGYRYAMTDPLGREKIFKKFASKPLVKLSNPLSEDFSAMRPNPLPTLIDAVARNINRGMRTAKLFEIDNGYSDDGKYEEEFYLAIAGGGMRNPINWNSDDSHFDFFDIKGTVEALLDAFRIKNSGFERDVAKFSDENSFLKIFVDGDEAGFVGTLSRSLWDFYELRQPVHFALLKIEPFVRYFSLTPKFKKFSRFPAIRRDVALIVDKGVFAKDLLDAAKNLSPDAEKIGIFDIYSGKPIPPDKKSLGLYFVFRSREKTLTDEDVNAKFKKIVDGLCEKFDAKVRE